MSETTEKATADQAEHTSPTAYPQQVTGERPQTYQPLSILALVGFGASVLYGGVVFLLALGGLVTQRHSLLPMWSILALLFAIGICLIAHVQIRQSDGALAGKKLTQRGIAICLFFGITYWAYFAAVYFAVRQQADVFAREWLQRIQEDKIEQAYLRTMKPGDRFDINESDKELFQKLVNRSLSEQGGQSGFVERLRSFGHHEYVQMLRMVGADAKIELLGIKSFDHVQGGFKVGLQYQVQSKYGTFHLHVSVGGSTATKGEYVGRQWMVNVQESGFDPSFRYSPTELGKHCAELRDSATNVARDFAQHFSRERDFVEAQLLNLRPERRLELKQRVARRNAVALLAGPALAVGEKELKMDLATVLPGREEFLNASIIDFSGIRLYGKPSLTEKKAIEAIVKTVKEDFRASDKGRQVQIMPMRGQAPDWNYDEQSKIITFRFPVAVSVSGEWNLRSVLVVKASLPELKAGGPKPDWWVDRIVLQEGAEPQAPAAAGAGP